MAGYMNRQEKIWNDNHSTLQMNKKKLAQQARNNIKKKQAMMAKIQDSKSPGNEIYESDDNDASSHLSPPNMSEFADKEGTFVTPTNIPDQSVSQTEADRQFVDHDLLPQTDNQEQILLATLKNQWKPNY